MAPLVALAPAHNYDNHSHVLNLDHRRVGEVRMTDRHGMPALPDRPEATDGAAAQPVFTTGQLFGAGHEIAIVHLGQTYRLRITRQGKLVLNK